MAQLLQALLLDIPELIETERLQLKASRPGEGALVHEAVVESYDRLATWMPWAREPQTAEQTEIHVREAHAKWLSRTVLDFTWYAAGGGVIGKGGLHTIDWSVPRFEIGYWVRSSAAGRGYATEGATALSEFARARLGAKRVEICCDVANVASRRVAEKSGFVLEGIRRQSRRNNAGDLADSCMYARTF